MDTDMITYLVVGIILGIIIGIIFSNVLCPKARKYNKTKHDLDEAKQELINQKQMIVKHFSHSAEILDNMAKDFRRLYQHMAENSSNLISEEDLKKALHASPSMKIDLTESIGNDVATVENPPKDYSGNPSGLLKTTKENEA